MGTLSWRVWAQFIRENKIKSYVYFPLIVWQISVPHDGYEGTIIAEPSGFGVVIPEDVQSAIKLCVPSGSKKGVFYINKSNSQIAKQYEE